MEQGKKMTVIKILLQQLARKIQAKSKKIIYFAP